VFPPWPVARSAPWRRRDIVDVRHRDQDAVLAAEQGHQHRDSLVAVHAGIEAGLPAQRAAADVHGIADIKSFRLGLMRHDDQAIVFAAMR
jgi:hypothetical protein